MALTVGKLLAQLDADPSGFDRGLDRAELEMQGFQRDVNGRLRDIHGRFVSEGEAAGRDFGDSIDREGRRSTSRLARLGQMLAVVVRGGLRSGMADDSKVIEGELVRSITRTIPAVARASQQVGTAAGTGMAAGVSATAAQDLPALFTPQGLIGAAIITVLAAVTGPAIGAALSAAILGGVGLGLIGVGALILKNNPAIVAAATALKNDVLSVMRTAAQPLVGPFVQALGIFNQTIKLIGPQLQGLFAAVAPAVKPLAEGLAGLVRNVLPGLQNAMIAGAPVLKAIGDALPGLGTALSDFFTSIGKGGPGAARFMTNLFALIGGTLRALGSFLGWLGQMYVKMGNFAQDVVRAWHAVTDWFSKLPGRIGDALTSAWRAVAGFVSSIGTTIGDFFTKTIPGWIDQGIGFFRSIGDQIAAALASLPGTLQTAAGNAFDAFFISIGYGIGTVIKFFQDLPGNIMAALDTVKATVAGWAGAVVGFFTALPGQIAGTVTALWTWLETKFQAGVDAVTGFVASLPGRLAWFLLDAFNRARTIVPRIIDTVVGFFASLPGRAAAALYSLGATLASALGSAGRWLYDAGRNIIMGLIRGIESAVGAAVDAVKRAMGDVIHGARQALGISSPSRVAAEVGRWIPIGLAVGMDAGTSQVAAAAARMAAAAVPTLAVPSLGQLTAAANNRPGAPGGAGPTTVQVFLGNDQLEPHMVRVIKGNPREVALANRTGVKDLNYVR